jgi:hypothetical protein
MLPSDYFKNLPQEVQSRVFETYRQERDATERFQNLKNTEMAKDAKAWDKLLEKMDSGKAIDPKKNYEAYLLGLSETFAELGALHELEKRLSPSLKNANGEVPFDRLVAISVVNGFTSPERGEFLKSLESTYRSLKSEVFNPFDRAAAATGRPPQQPHTGHVFKQDKGQSLVLDPQKPATPREHAWDLNKTDVQGRPQYEEIKLTKEQKEQILNSNNPEGRETDTYYRDKETGHVFVRPEGTGDKLFLDMRLRVVPDEKAQPLKAGAQPVSRDSGVHAAAGQPSSPQADRDAAMRLIDEASKQPNKIDAKSREILEQRVADNYLDKTAVERILSLTEDQRLSIEGFLGGKSVKPKISSQAMRELLKLNSENLNKFFDTPASKLKTVIAGLESGHIDAATVERLQSMNPTQRQAAETLLERALKSPGSLKPESFKRFTELTAKDQVELGRMQLSLGELDKALAHPAEKVTDMAVAAKHGLDPSDIAKLAPEVGKSLVSLLRSGNLDAGTARTLADLAASGKIGAAALESLSYVRITNLLSLQEVGKILSQPEHLRNISFDLIGREIMQHKAGSRAPNRLQNELAKLAEYSKFFESQLLTEKGLRDLTMSERPAQVMAEQLLNDQMRLPSTERLGKDTISKLIDLSLNGDMSPAVLEAYRQAIADKLLSPDALARTLSLPATERQIYDTLLLNRNNAGNRGDEHLRTFFDSRRSLAEARLEAEKFAIHAAAVAVPELFPEGGRFKTGDMSPQPTETPVQRDVRQFAKALAARDFAEAQRIVQSSGTSAAVEETWKPVIIDFGDLHSASAIEDVVKKMDKSGNAYLRVSPEQGEVRSIILPEPTVKLPNGSLVSLRDATAVIDGAGNRVRPTTAQERALVEQVQKSPAGEALLGRMALTYFEEKLIHANQGERGGISRLTEEFQQSLQFREMTKDKSPTEVNRMLREVEVAAALRDAGLSLESVEKILRSSAVTDYVERDYFYDFMRQKEGLPQRPDSPMLKTSSPPILDRSTGQRVTADADSKPGQQTVPGKPAWQDRTGLKDLMDRIPVSEGGKKIRELGDAVRKAQQREESAWFRSSREAAAKEKAEAQKALQEEVVKQAKELAKKLNLPEGLVDHDFIVITSGKDMNGAYGNAEHRLFLDANAPDPRATLFHELRHLSKFIQKSALAEVAPATYTRLLKESVLANVGNGGLRIEQDLQSHQRARLAPEGQQAMRDVLRGLKDPNVENHLDRLLNSKDASEQKLYQDLINAFGGGKAGHEKALAELKGELSHYAVVKQLSVIGAEARQIQQIQPGDSAQVVAEKNAHNLRAQMINEAIAGQRTLYEKSMNAKDPTGANLWGRALENHPEMLRETRGFSNAINGLVDKTLYERSTEEFSPRRYAYSEQLRAWLVEVKSQLDVRQGLSVLKELAASTTAVKGIQAQNLLQRTIEGLETSRSAASSIERTAALDQAKANAAKLVEALAQDPAAPGTKRILNLMLQTGLFTRDSVPANLRHLMEPYKNVVKELNRGRPRFTEDRDSEVKDSREPVLNPLTKADENLPPLSTAFHELHSKERIADAVRMFTEASSGWEDLSQHREKIQEYIEARAGLDKEIKEEGERLKDKVPAGMTPEQYAESLAKEGKGNAELAERYAEVARMRPAEMDVVEARVRAWQSLSNRISMLDRSITWKLGSGELNNRSGEGDYVVGKNEIRLNPIDFLSAKYGRDLANTFVHELVHQEQDITIIRALNQELQKNPAVLTNQDVRLQRLQDLYKERTGFNLDGEFALKVLERFGNVPLSEAQMERGLQLAESYHNYKERVDPIELHRLDILDAAEVLRDPANLESFVRDLSNDADLYTHLLGSTDANNLERILGAVERKVITDLEASQKVQELLYNHDRTLAAAAREIYLSSLHEREAWHVTHLAEEMQQTEGRKGRPSASGMRDGKERDSHEPLLHSSSTLRQAEVADLRQKLAMPVPERTLEIEKLSVTQKPSPPQEHMELKPELRNLTPGELQEALEKLGITDYASFQRLALDKETREMVALQVQGFEHLKVLVPKDYIPTIEKVRELRQKANSGDKNAESELKTGKDEKGREYRSVVLPEDVLSQLQELPDGGRQIRRIVLADKANPDDAWHAREMYGNKLGNELGLWEYLQEEFRSLATAKDATTVTVYPQGEEERDNLSRTIKHEMTHLLHNDVAFQDLWHAFEAAAELENAGGPKGSKGFFEGDYARVNDHEDWAVLGEIFQGKDGEKRSNTDAVSRFMRMVDAVRGTDSEYKILVMAKAFEKVLERAEKSGRTLSPQEQRVHDALKERVQLVQRELGQSARDSLIQKLADPSLSGLESYRIESILKEIGEKSDAQKLTDLLSKSQDPIVSARLAKVAGTLGGAEFADRAIAVAAQMRASGKENPDVVRSLLTTAFNTYERAGVSPEKIQEKLIELAHGEGAVRDWALDHVLYNSDKLPKALDDLLSRIDSGELLTLMRKGELKNDSDLLYTATLLGDTARQEKTFESIVKQLKEQGNDEKLGDYLTSFIMEGWEDLGALAMKELKSNPPKDAETLEKLQRVAARTDDPFNKDAAEVLEAVRARKDGTGNKPADPNSVVRRRTEVLSVDLTNPREEFVRNNMPVQARVYGDGVQIKIPERPSGLGSWNEPQDVRLFSVDGKQSGMIRDRGWFFIHNSQSTGDIGDVKGHITITNPSDKAAIDRVLIPLLSDALNGVKGSEAERLGLTGLLSDVKLKDPLYREATHADPHVDAHLKEKGEVAVGPKGQDAKDYTIYARNHADMEKAAKIIDKYLKDKGLTLDPTVKTTNVSDLVRLPLSNRISIDRDKWALTKSKEAPFVPIADDRSALLHARLANFPGAVGPDGKLTKEGFELAARMYKTNRENLRYGENGKIELRKYEGASLHDDLGGAIHQKYAAFLGADGKLTPEGLRQLAQDAGIADGQVVYDINGRLMFRGPHDVSLEDEDKMYVDEVHGSKEGTQKTGRAALYALYESVHAGKGADLRDPAKYVARKELNIR